MSKSMHIMAAEAKHLPFIVRWLNSQTKDRICPKKLTSTTEQTEVLANYSWGKDQLLIAHQDQTPIGMVKVLLTDPVAQIFKIESRIDDGQEASAEAEMLRLVVSQIFGQFNANKIYVELISGSPVIKAYEEVGFKQEVRKRQHYFYEGKFHNVLEFALTASEYDTRRAKSPTSAN